MRIDERRAFQHQILDTALRLEDDEPIQGRLIRLVKQMDTSVVNVLDAEDQEIVRAELVRSRQVPIFMGMGKRSEWASLELHKELGQCLSHIGGHQQFGGQGSGGTEAEYQAEKAEVRKVCEDFMSRLRVAFDLE